MRRDRNAHAHPASESASLPATSKNEPDVAQTRERRLRPGKNVFSPIFTARDCRAIYMQTEDASPPIGLVTGPTLQ